MLIRVSIEAYRKDLGVYFRALLAVAMKLWDGYTPITLPPSFAGIGV